MTLEKTAPKGAAIHGVADPFTPARIQAGEAMTHEALEAAERQVSRCYSEMLRYKDSDSRYARAESFRLAVMYRNSLMTPEQLAEIERKRGLR